MKNLIIAASLTVAFSTTAFAAGPFTPAATFTPEITTIPGRAIDIIGVTPGMTPDEAKLALSQTYEADRLHVSEFGYRMGKDNVWVETTPFANEIRFDDMFDDLSDRFSAKFTGPAGANRVATVERRVRFPQSGGPTEATLHAALLEKYGEPSYFQEGRFYIWQFKDGALVPCTNRSDASCSRPVASYDYIRDQKPAEMDYVIMADIEEGGYWQSNPRWMTTSLSDMRLINGAAVADFTALKDEWDRVNAVTAPIAAPKL